MYEVRDFESASPQPDFDDLDDIIIDPNEVLVDDAVNPDSPYEDGVLYASAVRKLTPIGYEYFQQSGRRRGPRQVAKGYNSFGLPAGVSCPGRTDFCKSCYGFNAEQITAVDVKMRHNFAQLSRLDDADKMAELLVPMVEPFIEQAEKRELPKEERVFRIHWDGDFYDTEYAEAWALTMAEYSDQMHRFLTFTRSIGFGASAVDVLPILAETPNLSLYLSLDENNAAQGQAQYDKWHDRYAGKLLRAWCTKDYESSRELAAHHSTTKASICPENARRVPLMDGNGVGACISCAKCFEGRGDVMFSTSHREIADPQGALDINVPEVEVRIGKPPTSRSKGETPPQTETLFSGNGEHISTQEKLFI